VPQKVIINNWSFATIHASIKDGTTIQGSQREISNQKED
jgi:hypothetical protein